MVRVVFPADWSVQTGSEPVIIRYAVGLAIITLGGALISMIGRVDPEKHAASEREASQQAKRIEELEAELADARAATGDSDTESGELREQIKSLQASQAQFELYADAGEQWGWRLRHHNGNVIADGGQGYAERTTAQKGIESVKPNVPGAEVVEA